LTVRRDRYRERIVFKNNATLFYGKIYQGGLRDGGDEMLEHAGDEENWVCHLRFSSS
jgi:hypothetical protein